METPNQFIITGDIAEKIGQETERMNKAANSAVLPESSGTEPYDLYAWRESFVEHGVKILPDTLAEAKLDEMKKELYKLKQRFPEGSEILLAAFPCDSNGFIYREDDIKNGKYFVILFVNSEKGLATGYGSGPGTQYRVLPAEIQAKCRFKVHYRSEESSEGNNLKAGADEKDFEDFSAGFMQAYRELQALIG